MNSFKNSIDQISVSSDVRIEHMKFDRTAEVLKSCQIDGYCIVLCTKGSFQIEISLEPYEIKKGTVIVYTPGNFFKMHCPPNHSSEDIELTTLVSSRQFTTGIQLNINKLYGQGNNISNFPCFRLDEREEQVLKQYFSLMENISSLGNDNFNTQQSLCSSVFYFLGSILSKETGADADLKGLLDDNRKVRAKEVFDEFIRLVSENNAKEKSLGFYADKLCISPKYLSKLVKNVSGRTAPDWINSFVILQAKNLLQYTSMNTKEIAYRLNFKSIPAFYKFFKSQTGMTPLEFKKK